MALKIYKKFTHNKVRMKSGRFYKFNYIPYQNEPQPHGILLYGIFGINPSTNHQWRLFQLLSLTYLPRRDRKRFIEEWKREWERSNGNVELTWEMVKRRFPYIQHTIRRYQTKPNYYVNRLEEIPYENWEAEVVKSWHKDFSSQIFRRVGAGLRRLFGGRR